jgi:hypothetical protein
VADGTGLLPAAALPILEVFGQTALFLSVSGSGVIGKPTISQSFTTDPNQPSIFVPPNVHFSIHLDLARSFSVVDNSRVLQSTFAVVSSDGASLDFLSTAQLRFDLLPGVTATSDAGYFQGGSVPEPSTMVLAGMGMLALGILVLGHRGGGARTGIDDHIIPEARYQ